MPYASMLDEHHRGLPLPMWAVIAGLVISIAAAAIEMSQAHVVRPVHRLAEPITAPTR